VTTLKLPTNILCTRIRSSRIQQAPPDFELPSNRRRGDATRKTADRIAAVVAFRSDVRAACTVLASTKQSLWLAHAGPFRAPLAMSSLRTGPARATVPTDERQWYSRPQRKQFGGRTGAPAYTIPRPGAKLRRSARAIIEARREDPQQPKNIRCRSGRSRIIERS